MNENHKQLITTTLKDKISTLTCPMCHHAQFTLLDGYLANVVQEPLEGLRLDGKYIPSVAILCGNCGFISQHAIGVLGLMEIIDNKENNEK